MIVRPPLTTVQWSLHRSAHAIADEQSREADEAARGATLADISDATLARLARERRKQASAS